MARLGIGIVGTNWAARGHLPGWRMLPDLCEVLAVCTTSEETAVPAAERLGLARAYAGIDAMLADPDIHIVSLGGPPPARTEMTMKALAAGRHVFSCIPFALTTDDALMMARTASDAKLVGALDAYFMWTPGYSFVKDLIDDGYLSELYAVTVDFSMAQAIMPPADYPYRWTGMAANGTGVLPNSCSHVFHTLLHLFGPIESVVGQSQISNKRWEFEDGSVQLPEVADTAVILARLQNGALVNIHAGRAVPAGTGLAITAYGSNGRLTIRSPAYPLDDNVTISGARPAHLFAGTEEPLVIPETYKIVPGGRRKSNGDSAAAVSLGRLFSRMLESIAGNGSAFPDFNRGTEVQRIIEDIERSQLEQRWQSVGRVSHDHTTFAA